MQVNNSDRFISYIKIQILDCTIFPPAYIPWRIKDDDPDLIDNMINLFHHKNFNFVFSKLLYFSIILLYARSRGSNWPSIKKFVIYLINSTQLRFQTSKEISLLYIGLIVRT